MEEQIRTEELAPEWLGQAAELCARAQLEGDGAQRRALAMALEQATGLSAGELLDRLRDGATLRVAGGGEGALALARALAAREAEMRGEEPELDLVAEMNGSPALVALLTAGEDLAEALDFAHPERVRQRAEREVLERIRKRNLRPLAMGAGAAARRPTADSLTEGQLREIDERLKRGERVRLVY